MKTEGCCGSKVSTDRLKLTVVAFGLKYVERYKGYTIFEANIAASAA